MHSDISGLRLIFGGSNRLVVRLIVGPLCDRWGPRLVFAGTLLAGAVPTILAGTISDARGLMVIRFFIGILGATFVSVPRSIFLVKV